MIITSWYQAISIAEKMSQYSWSRLTEAIQMDRAWCNFQVESAASPYLGNSHPFSVTAGPYLVSTCKLQSKSRRPKLQSVHIQRLADRQDCIQYIAMLPLKEIWFREGAPAMMYLCTPAPAPAESVYGVLTHTRESQHWKMTHGLTSRIFISVGNPFELTRKGDVLSRHLQGQGKLTCSQWSSANQPGEM